MLDLQEKIDGMLDNVEDEIAELQVRQLPGLATNEPGGREHIALLLLKLNALEELRKDLKTV